MSGVAATLLRVIPDEPGRVPSATARERAEAVLRLALPSADDVVSHVSEHVRFVDCGDNFESVACPRCGTEIGEWWSVVMEAAHEQHFRDLRATLPCCGQRLSLNDLVYSWPSGFARYSLEAMNPGLGSLPERVRARLESVLGCRVRVIWAHN
jgi:hypothetical protein